MHRNLDTKCITCYHKYNMFQEHTSHWQEIPDINQAIFNICQKENVKYIDLFTHFVDDNGQMKPEYTNDGLHLLGKGYMLWKEIITPYLKNKMKQSILISLVWLFAFCGNRYKLQKQ